MTYILKVINVIISKLGSVLLSWLIASILKYLGSSLTLTLVYNQYIHSLFSLVVFGAGRFNCFPYLESYSELLYVGRWLRKSYVVTYIIQPQLKTLLKRLLGRNIQQYNCRNSRSRKSVIRCYSKCSFVSKREWLTLTSIQRKPYVACIGSAN